MKNTNSHKKYDLEKTLAQEEIYKIKKKAKGNANKISTPMYISKNINANFPFLNQKNSFHEKKAKNNDSALKKPKNTEKSEFSFSSQLKNLISKSESRLKNDEVDLFANENNSIVDNTKNMEFENYLLFLKNNMSNKNISVISIDDDEMEDKTHDDLWKNPLADIQKLNDKYLFVKNHKIDRKKQIYNENFLENFVVNKKKWENVYTSEIPFINNQKSSKKPKIINLNK